MEFFFHHTPSQQDEKVINKNIYLLKLEKYLNYIQTHLGEETLQLWFNVD